MVNVYAISSVDAARLTDVTFGGTTVTLPTTALPGTTPTLTDFTLINTGGVVAAPASGILTGTVAINAGSPDSEANLGGFAIEKIGRAHV